MMFVKAMAPGGEIACYVCDYRVEVSGGSVGRQPLRKMDRCGKNAHEFSSVELVEGVYHCKLYG